MDNVIRPTFGAPRAPSAPSPEATASATRPLHLYGEAAGHRVGLLRDEDGPEGRTHRVVVGRLDGDAVEAVAIVPATREGEIDAERTALAILRTLEIVEAR